MLFTAPGFSRLPMLLINTEIALFLDKTFEVWECSIATRIGCCGRSLQRCDRKDPAKETPADVELHSSFPPPSSTAAESGRSCRGCRELPGGFAGLGCLRWWWQQLLHVLGELVWCLFLCRSHLMVVLLQILFSPWISALASASLCFFSF